MTRKLSTLLVVMALTGCRPAAKAPLHDTFTKLGGGKADATVPTIQYGATATVSTNYGYGWLQFTGNIGDKVDLWARSHKGDAVAFLLDENDDVIASNDDCDEGGSDAHLVATLPADGTYWIAVRDYNLGNIKIDVTVEGTGVYTCKLDTDCVAVPKAGCCDNGWLDAVNKDEVVAYDAFYACTNPAPICPASKVVDARIAECSNATHKCEMIDPAQIRCGGNVVNAHQCPDGWSCNYMGRVPDVAGVCQQAAAAQ